MSRIKSISAIAGAIALCVVAIAMITGCSDTQSQAFKPKMVFHYTGVGDDGTVGCATVREFRVSTDSALIANTPGSATIVAVSNITPACGGQPDSMVVTSFTALTKVKYFFRVRSGDDENPINWSGYSNIATRIWADTIAPAIVVDLQ